MQFINRLYGWYGKRVVWGFFGAVALLFVVGLIFQFIGNTAPVDQRENLPLVRLQSVRDIVGVGGFSVVGTVASISEAHLQTESSGRVTSVRVGLGDTVSAGQIVATLENASQAAAVLQAEGAYEAALAAAATSEVSEASAQTALTASLQAGVNAYRSAFIAADAAVRGTADQIISNPRSQSPGIQIDAFGRAPSLSTERVAIDDLLENWSRAIATIATLNVEDRLPAAQSDLNDVAQFIEELAHIVDRQRPSELSDSEKAALQASFLSARNTLASQRAALTSAQTNIETSEETLLRAQIASSNGSVSSADAQVKQALGALRAAQANYAKSIIRTPITGTINSVDVASGDYVNAFVPAVTVANNNALKITAYVNEMERARLQIGQEVVIENTTSGRIARIAPAVDARTGKAEIEIQTESTELTNGDTVSITITESNTTVREDTPDTAIVVPITALKVETDRIVIFTVSEESRLVAHAITEGPLLGSNILIESGLTLDMHIVLDARGLNEGDAVAVAN